MRHFNLNTIGCVADVDAGNGLALDSREKPGSGLLPGFNQDFELKEVL
jgi:hypothetical protein